MIKAFRHRILILALILLILMVTIFLILPISKLGFKTWLCYEYISNPVISKITNKYFQYRYNTLYKQWYSQIDTLALSNVPNIQWTDSINGINEFYVLDQQSEDVTPLLQNKAPFYNIPWIKTRFGEQYLQPDTTIIPCYNYIKSDSCISIQTDSHPDTWVYFVSKKKFPKVYALDFYFTTHTETEETLQIDFCTKSLADRLRFLVIQNKLLRFQVVDHAFFLGNKTLQKDFSFSKHTPTRVRLEIINNIFAIFINNHLEMAIRINNYHPESSSCYFLFWNGDKKEEIKFEISDFIIKYPKNNIDGDSIQ